METVDISSIFPLKSEHDVNAFFAKDEEWNERRKARINYYSRRKIIYQVVKYYYYYLIPIFRLSTSSSSTSRFQTGSSLPPPCCIWYLQESIYHLTNGHHREGMYMYKIIFLLIHTNLSK